MPAAYSPDTPDVDQNAGPHSSNHGKAATRFNEIDSRGTIQLGATVTEAIAQAKRGDFTEEDLKQLAFAMGFQIVGGKDTPAVWALIGELRSQLAAAEKRAVGAEGAFIGKHGVTVESVTAIAATMGLRTISETDAQAAESALAAANEQVTALTARAEAAESALAAEQKPAA